MDHIAIMSKKHDLISKILSGEKTIESRWYKSRIAPWDRITAGDKIFFKYSGCKVTASAEVDRVLQFDNLNEKSFNEITRMYGDAICLNERKYTDFYKKKRYVILLFLKNAHLIDKPFAIDKSGFGSACAWLTVKNVADIKYKKVF